VYCRPKWKLEERFVDANELCSVEGAGALRRRARTPTGGRP
jgi:hypothetical protein